MGSIADSLNQHSNSIGRLIDKLPSETREFAHQIQDQVTSLLEVIASNTQLMNQNILSNLELHLQSMISEAQVALASTTKSLGSDVEGFTNSLDAVVLSWNSRLVGFNKRLDVMWDESFARNMALDQALEKLEARVSDATSQVDTQISKAEKLQELTFETSASIKSSNAQMANASQTLSNELTALRSVAQELQMNLTQMPRFALDFRWIRGLTGAVSLIADGLRPSTWQAHLVMQVVGAGASGIYQSFSLFLTFGCALLFLVTHVFRLIAHLARTLAGWCFRNTKELDDQVIIK
ncbi:hypothetical protein RhiJN_18231 [Ceratobasidium sp. AG-Ba]|nr:hypothetical protein RhiJN_18231 [Ceratobasidium sp. AG-Ba]